jgi:RNA polymerase sigma-70 factor (ECF subfamily)
VKAITVVATNEATGVQSDLVVRASAGDHDAFSELATSAVDRLYRVAFLILRDDELAKDALQNALFAAWRDIRGLRDPDRFEAWLRRLTLRACYRVASSARRRAAAEQELLPLHDLAAPDADERLVAVRDELDRAFKQLSAQERSVIVLHYYLDLSLSDAADALGIPLGTMKSRLSRATQALRAAIESQERAAAMASGGIA